MFFNYSQCIRQASSWGHETFLNICNGETHILQWGSLDWTQAIAGPVIFAGILTAAVALTIAIFSYEPDDVIYLP